MQALNTLVQKICTSLGVGQSKSVMSGSKRKQCVQWVSKCVGTDERKSTLIVSAMVQGVASTVQRADGGLEGYTKRAAVRQLIDRVIAVPMDTQALKQWVREDGLIEKMHLWSDWVQELQTQAYEKIAALEENKNLNEQEHRKRSGELAQRQVSGSRHIKMVQIFGVAQEQLEQRLQEVEPSVLQIGALVLAHGQLVNHLFNAHTPEVQKWLENIAAVPRGDEQSLEERVRMIGQACTALRQYISQQYDEVFEGKQAYWWWHHMADVYQKGQGARDVVDNEFGPAVYRHARFSKAGAYWGLKTHSWAYQEGSSLPLYDPEQVKTLKVLWDEGYVGTVHVLELLQKKEMRTLGLEGAGARAHADALVLAFENSMRLDASAFWSDVKRHISSGQATQRWEQLVQCYRTHEDSEEGKALLRAIEQQPLEHFEVSSSAIEEWQKKLMLLTQQLPGGLSNLNDWVRWGMQNEDTAPMVQRWLRLFREQKSADSKQSVVSDKIRELQSVAERWQLEMDLQSDTPARGVRKFKRGVRP